MGLPIIFIHNGDAKYLNFALDRAKKSNPKSRLIVIGSNISPKIGIAEYFDVNDFDKSAKLFSKKYIHLSTLNYDFELFCFQRWFILNEFMLKNKIRKCLYLDSDVLLYTDVTKDQDNYSKFMLAYSNNTSGHVMFVNSLKFLDKFCTFTTKLYTYEKNLSILKKMFQNRKNQGLTGGVCDMTALLLFYESNSKFIFDVSKVLNGGIYDHNINSSDGFEMFCELKKIKVVNGLPYASLTSTGEKVLLKAIHCQGISKKIMSQFSDMNFSELNIMFYYFNRKIKSFVKKLF
jgi:hypothetical protein